MEINSTHGEFHVCAGGDEKLKNYFAWPKYIKIKIKIYITIKEKCVVRVGHDHASIISRFVG